VLVAGAGTGAEVAGAGTGAEIAGAGTGADAITVTLPGGTGLAMEVIMGCGSASVAVLDSASVPVVLFPNVPVRGDSGFCSSESAAGFATVSDRDYRFN